MKDSTTLKSSSNSLRSSLYVLPINVVAIFSNDDVEKAREFLQSDHIKEAMQSAGVVSEPQFIELQ